MKNIEKNKKANKLLTYAPVPAVTVVIAPGPPGGVFRHNDPDSRSGRLLHPPYGARVADGGPLGESVGGFAVPVVEIAKLAALGPHVQAGDFWF